MPEVTVHRESPPAYETRHDFSSSESLHLTVVEALAAVADVPKTDVPPLYDAVEVDSLERLFEHADARGSTAFAVGEWTVAVHGDGRVLVYDCEETPESATRP